MSTQTLFSLQGYLRIARYLPDGKIGPLRWLGNVPEATLALSTEATDKNEAYSGQRLQIGRLTTGVSAALNYTMDYWSVENLALAFNAAPASIGAGTVTGEVFPAGLAVGDQVRLDHPFVSSLVITDSATPTPAPVNALHYRKVGHADSVVEILNLASYVQPLKAAYAHAAVNNTVMFSQLGEAVYLQFDAVNTENNEPVLIDLWKARHNPVAELALINSEYGSLAMTAAILADPVRGADASLGNFGRMMQRAE